MIRDPRVGPVDIRANKRTKRWVVGRLPTQGWGWEDKTGRKKKKKKREEEAVCGFLWSELGTHSRSGGPESHRGVLSLTSGGGLGTMGQSLGGWRSRHSPAERAWERPLSRPREAQVQWGHPAPQWTHVEVGPQPFPASSCHLSCSLHFYPGSMRNLSFGPGSSGLSLLLLVPSYCHPGMTADPLGPWPHLQA